jgi:hypothetical protein
MVTQEILKRSLRLKMKDLMIKIMLFFKVLLIMTSMVLEEMPVARKR